MVSSSLCGSYCKHVCDCTDSNGSNNSSNCNNSNNSNSRFTDAGHRTDDTYVAGNPQTGVEAKSSGNSNSNSIGWMANNKYGALVRDDLDDEDEVAWTEDQEGLRRTSSIHQSRRSKIKAPRAKNWRKWTCKAEEEVSCMTMEESTRKDGRSLKSRSTQGTQETQKSGGTSHRQVVEKVMPIKTIEPEGLHTITEDGMWEEIKLSVDSGATESVVPETMPSSIPTVEGSASRRGVMYEVANGERIPNEGEKKFKAVTAEGKEKQMVMQVCDVNQGLLSVSKATAAGNRVVFDSEGSYIQSKDSGEVTWLHEEGGMYVLRLWVRRPF